MRRALWLCAVAVGICVATTPAGAEETPKYGGTLTYMIPADAPPSFDSHREQTYATIHSAAPFYSTLFRFNPNDPAIDHRHRLRCIHRDDDIDRLQSSLHLQNLPRCKVPQ